MIEGRATRLARAAGRRRRLALVAACCLAASCSLLLASRASARRDARESFPLPATSRAFAFASSTAAAQDWSRFTHVQPEHARQQCLLCHRREDGATRPRFPGHTPCAGCHQQQFASQNFQFCSICHSNPPAEALKSFPGLRTFGARFDHAQHARGPARPRDGCNACHRPARRGVALSIPAGAAAHQTCWGCHTSRAQGPTGRDISTCGACHQLGQLVRVSEGARAYAVNFSHAEHTKERLACNDCHTVRAGAGRGRQVSSPFPSQHRAPAGTRSCASCHDNRRAFGGDDFTDCKRCHEGNAWHY